jgi:hypothetical protein
MSRGLSYFCLGGLPNLGLLIPRKLSPKWPFWSKYKYRFIAHSVGSRGHILSSIRLLSICSKSASPESFTAHLLQSLHHLSAAPRKANLILHHGVILQRTQAPHELDHGGITCNQPHSTNTGLDASSHDRPLDWHLHGSIWSAGHLKPRSTGRATGIHHACSTNVA